MTDSPGRGRPYDPNQVPGSYSGYSDPAYAGNLPYGPSYSGPQPPPNPNPTEPLRQHWSHPYGQLPPGPPEPPRSPRWLWFAAGAAVLLVVALVIAVVIADSSSSKQTIVAPLPAMPQPTTTSTPETTPPSTTPGFPLPTEPALPTVSAPSTETTEPSNETESVVYQVTGEGRAINITYVDTGSMMQTEFNVALPWQKEIELPKSATESASVTVINIGHDVTCSITVSGVQIRERTGAGLTVCTATG